MARRENKPEAGEARSPKAFSDEIQSGIEFDAVSFGFQRCDEDKPGYATMIQNNMEDEEDEPEQLPKIMKVAEAAKKSKSDRILRKSPKNRRRSPNQKVLEP